VSGAPTYPATLTPKPRVGSSSVPFPSTLSSPSLSAPRWTSRLLAARNPVRKPSCRDHLMSFRSQRCSYRLLPGSFISILPSGPFQLLFSSVRPFWVPFATNFFRDPQFPQVRSFNTWRRFSASCRPLCHLFCALPVSTEASSLRPPNAPPRTAFPLDLPPNPWPPSFVDRPSSFHDRHPSGRREYFEGPRTSNSRPLS
jgi:hypothetical protein